MEAMLAVFGAALLAFAAALVSLLRVRGTCAGTCERLDQLACESCPRAAERRARGERGGRDEHGPRKKEQHDVSAW